MEEFFIDEVCVYFHCIGLNAWHLSAHCRNKCTEKLLVHWNKDQNMIFMQNFVDIKHFQIN